MSRCPRSPGTKQTARTIRLLAPAHIVKVKPGHKGRLNDSEVGRDVEIPRDKKTVVPNPYDFIVAVHARRIFAWLDGNLWQNRVVNGLKRLRDER